MSLKIDRRPGARSKIWLATAFVVAGLLCGSLLSAQEKAGDAKKTDDAKKDDAPAAAVFNAEYAKLQNPEKNTPETITAGRNVYMLQCVNCHGKSVTGTDGGDNRGGTDIPDLTDDVWLFGGTDGEIFMSIKEGTGSPDMTAYKDLVEDKEIWQMVHFIRSMAKKPRAR